VSQVAGQVLFKVGGELVIGCVQGKNEISVFLQAGMLIAVVEVYLRETKMAPDLFQKGADECGRDWSCGKNPCLLCKGRLVEITDTGPGPPGQGHHGKVVSQYQGIPLSGGHGIQVIRATIDDTVEGIVYTIIPSRGIDLAPTEITDGGSDCIRRVRGAGGRGDMVA
jgi:hypothetical protein